MVLLAKYLVVYPFGPNIPYNHPLCVVWHFLSRRSCYPYPPWRSPHNFPTSANVAPAPKKWHSNISKCCGDLWCDVSDAWCEWCVMWVMRDVRCQWCEWCVMWVMWVTWVTWVTCVMWHVSDVSGKLWCVMWDVSDVVIFGGVKTS